LSVNLNEESHLMPVFQQPLAPIGGSLALSALVAAIPLALLFVLLGVFKVKAWMAAIVGLVVSMLIAVVGWQMPALMTFAATAEGAFYGAFPIMWILLNAIWVYQLSVITGWFEQLGQLIRSISDDQRILAILIAFCFGALMEALAGFGAPVAISAAMLMACPASPGSTSTCSPRWPAARRRSSRSSSRWCSCSSSTASGASSRPGR